MLLWLVMVLVFIVLLVGGTGYYFYAQETMEFSNIPEIKVGEVAVSASGFDYNLPVLGGVFYKHTAAVRDSALAQTVSTDSTAVPIVTGQEVGDVTVTLSRYSEQVFSGSLAEYESFRFSANGTYDCRITVAHAKAQSDERPRAYGEVYYDCAIAVEVRSVNHRYFEYTSRLPRSCSFLDDRLKKLVQCSASRGKVDLGLTV
ncbi:MAG: YicC/YloC family endoribonuclease, partial [Pygmaiobacter sp.]